MNTAARIPLPEYDMADCPPVTHRECDECEGSGEIVTFVRAVGEAIDGDLCSRRCTDCQGLGEFMIDPECPYCESEVSGDRCENCLLIFAPDARHIGGGTYRVEL